MSRRKFSDFCDKLFWYLIYLFPLILAVVTAIPTDGMSAPIFTTFNSVMSQIGIPTNNIISGALAEFGIIFGDNLFAVGTFLNSYITYLFCATLIHLVFDVLAFIPRLGHKWIGRCLE